MSTTNVKVILQNSCGLTSCRRSLYACISKLRLWLRGTLSFTLAHRRIPVIVSSLRMGYKESYIIELKFFEISCVGFRVVSILDQGRKVTKEVVLNFTSMFWVAKTLEECFHVTGSKELIRTFRHGDIAFIAQRLSNMFGSFLYFEFRGGGQSSLLIFPEEIERHGWMKMAEELRVLCGSENKKLKRDVSLCRQKLGAKTYAEVVRAPTSALWGVARRTKGNMGRKDLKVDPMGGNNQELVAVAFKKRGRARGLLCCAKNTFFNGEGSKLAKRHGAT